MKLSDSNIVWEGECSNCNGGRLQDAMLEKPCHDCDGTGTITRDATLEESSRALERSVHLIGVINKETANITMLKEMHKCTGEALTINGGILKCR